MIWEEPIHRFRNVTEWLQDLTYPSGIDQYILEKGKKTLTERYKQGMLFLIPGKDPREDVGRVLAALADYADTVDSSPACQALDWIKSNAWYEPSEMMFADMIRTTDVLVLYLMPGVPAKDIPALDAEVAVRAYGSPKITFLLGSSAAPLINSIGAHGSRVMEI